ncbi:MAG: hypothetical protein RL264_2326 [Bacteroidota bacterium]|jgi:UDP-GlcNAc3NAcA epimerase
MARKIVSIIGARPQIIKSAALHREWLKNYQDKIEEVVIHTGQHYDENLSAVFFKELQLPLPKFNLEIGSGNHGAQTGKMLQGIEEILLSEKPDMVVVYGDTNSTLAGALAASKLQIPVAHIEAGLRSFNKKMPEEINRILTDNCSDLLFTPTSVATQHLVKEGFDVFNQVVECGDIMYDNALHFGKQIDSSKAKEKFIFCTIHRDFNTVSAERLMELLQAVKAIAALEKCQVIFPIHPRTEKLISSDIALKNLLESDVFQAEQPLSYLETIAALKQAELVITDSGGLQKEASFFNQPCLVLRHETEWEELIASKKAFLAGNEFDTILTAYHEMKTNFNPEEVHFYGHGNTATTICSTIMTFLENKD